MRLNAFELIRVWAALTGVVLAMWYFGELYFEFQRTAIIPMLVAVIGGFEFFLFWQDVWLEKRGRHG